MAKLRLIKNTRNAETQQRRTRFNQTKTKPYNEIRVGQEIAIDVNSCTRKKIERFIEFKILLVSFTEFWDHLATVYVGKINVIFTIHQLFN